MTEIIAAHLERARELVNHILEYVDEGQLDEYADIAQEAMVNPVAAALAACAREELQALLDEHESIIEDDLGGWEVVRAEYIKKRIAALERAAGEK